MKMRKLQISDYDVVMKVRGESGQTEEKKVPYRVADSLSMLLFHPELRLGGKELLANGKLCDKIEACKKGFILLTEDEFASVKKVFDTVKGFGKNEIELVRRVEECEEVDVDVTEKKQEEENKESSVPAAGTSSPPAEEGKKKRRGRRKK